MNNNTGFGMSKKTKKSHSLLIPILDSVGTAGIETMSRVTSFIPRTQTGNCSSYNTVKGENL